MSLVCTEHGAYGPLIFQGQSKGLSGHRWQGWEVGTCHQGDWGRGCVCHQGEVGLWASCLISGRPASSLKAG